MVADSPAFARQSQESDLFWAQFEILDVAIPHPPLGARYSSSAARSALIWFSPQSHCGYEEMT